jgi:hypothetical protein
MSQIMRTSLTRVTRDHVQGRAPKCACRGKHTSAGREPAIVGGASKHGPLASGSMLQVCTFLLIRILYIFFF